MATSDVDSSNPAPAAQNIIIDFGDNDNSEGLISDSDPPATPGIVQEGPTGHLSSKEEETTEPDINFPEAMLTEEPGNTQTLLKSKEKVQKIFQRFSNMRTLVICLWIIQNSVVSSFLVHPQSSHLSGLQPLTTKFSSSLVAIGRLLLVPCLYFIAGFEAKFYPLLVYPSKYFVEGRARRTYFMMQSLKLAAWMSTRTHSAVLTTSKHHTLSIGYYVYLQPGHDPLLNGPLFFAISIGYLDVFFYIYSHTKSWITGIKTQPKLTKRQYVCAHVLMLGILCVYVQSNALSAILDRLPDYANELIYAVNGASAHFPILYLFAYYAGTRIHSYSGALTAMHSARRRASLSAILCFAFLGLTALDDYFPHIIGPSLDLRRKPTLTVQLYGTRNDLITKTVAEYLFGMWMIIVISFASETILITVLSSKVLGRSWGSFTRYAYIQVHTQMILGFAPNAYVQKITDNVLLRGVIHGILSIIVGYLVGILNSVLARIFAKLRSMFKERWTQKANVALDGV